MDALDLLDRDMKLTEIAVKAQPIFEKNGWEYRGAIPDVSDIFANLDRLCSLLSDNPDSEIACGRFTVFYSDGDLNVVPDFEME